MKSATFFGLMVVLVLALMIAVSGGVWGAGPAGQNDLQAGRGPSAAVGSAFTYQGRLTEGGRPANGRYDFVFKLFDAPMDGAQLMPDVIKEDVVVTGGLFTVELDFGDVFDGTAVWLQIEVRPGSESGAYTVLSPRQSLTAAPYALGLVPGATITGTVSGGMLALGNAAGDGLAIPRVGEDGIEIDHAAGDGLVVCATGNETSCTLSDYNNGLEVGNADGYGVRVDSTGLAGFHVDSAGTHGVVVRAADSVGMWIDDVGFKGLYVRFADDDGVYVQEVGGDGVHVGRAYGDGVYVGRADGNGVLARSHDPDGYGGRFTNFADGTSGVGLYARGSAGQAPDIVLGANGGGTAADDGRIVSDPAYDGSDIRFFSNDNLWIDLDESDTHSGSNFTIRDSENNTVWSVDETGTVTNRGASSNIVETADGGAVQMYGMGSPENWFEDFGSGSLVNGKGIVNIDPAFAATVNLKETYHVFLTPLGDCALFVAEKAVTHFSVQALGGATCGIDFDYRLVARRAGYENLRMEKVELSREEE